MTEMPFENIFLRTCKYYPRKMAIDDSNKYNVRQWKYGFCNKRENKKYHTARTVPQSNKNIVERKTKRNLYHTYINMYNSTPSFGLISIWHLVNYWCRYTYPEYAILIYWMSPLHGILCYYRHIYNNGYWYNSLKGKLLQYINVLSYLVVN